MQSEPLATFITKKPWEISFYYSKEKLLIDLLPVFLLVFPIILLLFLEISKKVHTNYSIYLIIFLFSSVIIPIAINLKKIFDTEVQLKISDEAILVKNLSSYSWTDIHKASFINIASSRGNSYLDLELKNGDYKSIEITYLKQDIYTIKDIIDIWPERTPEEKEKVLQEKKEGTAFIKFMLIVIILIIVLGFYNMNNLSIFLFKILK